MELRHRAPLHQRVRPMTVSRAAWAAALVQAALAYDLGNDITLCWVTTAGGTAEREQCQGAQVSFLRRPSSLVAYEAAVVEYDILVPAARHPDCNIPHANLHSCSQTVGFCNPFVANTPGLATHTTAISSTLVADVPTRLESTMNLEEGIYTVIAHGRWFDGAGARHDMSRAFFITVEPVLYSFFNNSGALLLVVCLALAGAILALLGARALRRYVIRHRRMRNELKLALEGRKARVQRACDSVNTLAFPMVCLPLPAFLAAGRLVSYEEARERGVHVYMDTTDDVRASRSRQEHIIFLSHQVRATRPRVTRAPRDGYNVLRRLGDVCPTSALWQWYGEGADVAGPSAAADPEGFHFAAAAAAMQALVESNKLNAAAVLVWIDVSCIPQRSRALQTLSIGSLACYALSASFFLVVAPTVRGRRGDTPRPRERRASRALRRCGLRARAHVAWTRASRPSRCAGAATPSVARATCGAAGVASSCGRASRSRASTRCTSARARTARRSRL